MSTTQRLRTDRRTLPRANSQRAHDGAPLTDALAFLERLWRLNHALERMSSRMQRDLGITAQQRLVVRCIGRSPDLSPTRLAALLHVDPGTVSSTLRRLDAMGVVRREGDARDGRRVKLRLTARGRALARPQRTTVEGSVQRLLTESSVADLAVSHRVLESLTRILTEEASAP